MKSIWKKNSKDTAVVKYAPYKPQYPGLEPMKSVIPKWYKDTPLRVEGTSVSDKKLTVKCCTPFLESLITGYLIPLVADIEVFEQDNLPMIKWVDSDDVILKLRPSEAAGSFPIPTGHHPDHFVWMNQLAIKLPKGFSALITHPLNRHDLPFTTLSAVIDSENEYVFGTGSVPFFVKEGFTGVIKRGTPIAQVIPFKLESCKSERDDSILDQANYITNNSRSTFIGWYKEHHWKQKRFD
jgi:hypothetical protein